MTNKIILFDLAGQLVIAYNYKKQLPTKEIVYGIVKKHGDTFKISFQPNAKNDVDPQHFLDQLPDKSVLDKIASESGKLSNLWLFAFK